MSGWGSYLRGLWKQKPHAWGPTSVVQSFLFERLQQYGINPNLLRLALPCWNPRSQYNYATAAMISNTCDFKNNALYTGNTSALITDTISDISTTKYTLLVSYEGSPSSLGRIFANTTESSYLYFKNQSTLELKLESSTIGNFSISTTKHNLVLNSTGVFQGPGHKIYSNGSQIASFDRARDLFGTVYFGNRPALDRPSGIHINTILMYADTVPDWVALELSENPYQFWQRPTFKTYSIPAGIPVINYPANDDTNISQPITFSWSSVTGAVNYQLQIADTEAGLDTLPEIDTTVTAPTTTKDIDGLDPSTTYYSRVRAEI